MKSILVTGATGFLGYQVLKHLAQQEVSLTVVVRNKKKNSFDDIPNLKKIIYTENIFTENKEWWVSILENIDTVIHAAWYAQPGEYLQSERNWDCLQGTLTLASAVIEAEVKRFIGIGTCFEYDLSYGMLSVDTPLKPSSPYAAAKVSTFIALSQWLPSNSVEFAWCRLFYLYGEGENKSRFVPYLRSKLVLGECAELSSGNQIRDFMDVKDASYIIASIALNESQGPFNICSGIPITVRQLAESIADEFGRRDLINFGARPDNLVDPVCVVGVKNFK